MNRPSPWRLAASTLGVLDEDLPTTVEILTRHGAQAVELRSAPGAFIHTGLSARERDAVRGHFLGAGIDVFAVASQVRVAAAGSDDEAVAALLAELELASDLGARFVRVFPGAPTTGSVNPDQTPELAEAPEDVAERVSRRLASVFRAAHVSAHPVIETHDSHPRGVDVARLIEAVTAAAPGYPVGAVWDALHPWRVGEGLDDTAQVLLPHVADGRGYVQIKDVPSRLDLTPVLQGQGAVPTDAFLELLEAAQYGGPVSLEWERFWRPDVAPLDEALAAAAEVLGCHDCTE